MTFNARTTPIASSSKSLFNGLKPEILEYDVAEAHPLNNCFDAFKLAAAEQLATALKVSMSVAFNALETGRKGCDLNLPIPKLRLGKAVEPKAAAQRIVNEFQPNDYLSEAFCSGINISFTVRTKTLASLLLNQINELEHIQKPTKEQCIGFGSNSSGFGKKYVVEYSSPNIAKPFHAGHLRSTIIGAFLACLYEANGWAVHRINYLGDWGKQFGLLSVGYRKYGSDEELQKDAIKHLYDVYVKINSDARAEIAEHVKESRAARRAAGEANVPADDAEPTRPENDAANNASPTHNAARQTFQKLEAREPAEYDLWKKFRELSILKFGPVYGRLNVRFDEYLGESQVSPEMQNEALEQLMAAKIVAEDQGALVADLDQYKLGRTIVRKRDGTTTYISRDIAEAVHRYNTYKFDKMTYVVASQQDMYLAQLFKCVSLLGFDWAKNIEHINHGMIGGMSTRKGTAVFLEQILDEARDVMHEQMQKSDEKYVLIDDPLYTSDVLGISAVKIQDMSAKRINNYDFNWSRMTSYIGDTGPYLQYAHVRVTSIVRKAAPEVVLPPPADIASAINTDLLTEPKARDVLMVLASWPDAVAQSWKSSEPSTIVTFCWRLTHAISSAYEVLSVKGAEPDIALARLFLYVCAKDVLANAMKLLTLTPLERM